MKCYPQHQVRLYQMGAVGSSGFQMEISPSDHRMEISYKNYNSRALMNNRLNQPHRGPEGPVGCDVLVLCLDKLEVHPGYIAQPQLEGPLCTDLFVVCVSC